jgi:glycosyltransferase involved in cell wall biosynthesis
MSDRQFSVLIATYEGDDPDDLSRALQSVIDQTVRPDEIVVVADGSLTTDLEAVLDDFESAYPDLLTRTSLPTNQGLGAALNHGVETCSYEWIGRLDSDDIAVENRFERQLTYLDENPETDVLGGYIGEFSNDPADIETTREVPTTPDQVRSIARFRCPLNHPTVIFRRSAVLEVGNYRPLRSMQDYDLWMRMLAKEYQLSNIPTILVKCEGGEELFNRRGGLTYARIETKLQYEFLQLGMISVPVFLLNICVRIPLRLIPNRLRSFVYRTLLRN